MKKIIFSLFISSFVFVACNKNDSQDNKDSYAYFSKELKANMDYDSIVNKFGQPDEDKGSGIHIYVYKLQDGTEIWIGYTDRILYARHMSNNGQLLHTLI